MAYVMAYTVEDTMSDALTDFLLARIAEDEASARAATPGPWWHDPTKWNAIDHEESVFAGERGLRATCIASTGPESAESVADAAHIARYDPARVLAECEAKRRIVEWHKSWPVLSQTPPAFEPIDSADPSTFAMRASQQMAWLTEQEYRDRFGSEPPTGPVVRLLALPYADHPDYREEWRP